MVRWTVMITEAGLGRELTPTGSKWRVINTDQGGMV